MKPIDLETQLIEDIAGFHHDPLGFVRYAFPWGEPGELADFTGPRDWQAEVLEEIGRKLREGVSLGEAVQIAVASGHGIGKSALVSMIILWAISTREDTRGVVTANTDTQLSTKTWAELAKWYRLCMTSHWFQFTATALFSVDPKHSRTWRIDAIPWNEQRPESFAGLHNQGRRILVLFDEASAIPDKIWEVTEGALTDADTEIIWTAFGNPTRNSGRFYEAFGKLRHRWSNRQIDSRTVPGTSLVQIRKWVDDYGEDSDFVRVRVRGVFPRSGSTQFIAGDVVDAAMHREATASHYDPLIIGADVARFGDDSSVIYFRRGRDGRTIPPRCYRGMDTMQFAARISEAINERHPDAVFVDETGVGGGVIDRLRQLGHRVIGVNNGAKPDGGLDEVNVANKGAECWSRARAWLRDGGAIPDDAELRTDLTAREYGFNAHNAIVLEPKDAMKRRGLGSPDKADALALTFAHPVGQRALPPSLAMGNQGPPPGDWDPFAS